MSNNNLPMKPEETGALVVTPEALGGIITELMRPVMQTIGTESSIASAIPVTRFEAPGPEVATQTPTWLLARAKPLAARAAPCSWRTKMCFSDESTSAS